MRVQPRNCVPRACESEEQQDSKRHKSLLHIPCDFVLRDLVVHNGNLGRLNIKSPDAVESWSNAEVGFCFEVTLTSKKRILTMYERKLSKKYSLFWTSIIECNIIASIG